MELLVVGGTQMVGRCLVEHLIKEKKHEITLANRGITNPHLFDLDRITIDRDKDCQQLLQYKFDCVVDTSCYNVEQFNNVYNNLFFDHYLYVSTVGVQEEFLRDKSNPLYNYCLNKKKVEDRINFLSDKRITIYRPVAIYGKYDYTGRFEEKDGKYYLKHTDYCVNDDPRFMSQEQVLSDMTKLLEEIAL